VWIPALRCACFSCSGVSGALRLPRAPSNESRTGRRSATSARCALDERRLLALHALAIVLEVGLDPPKRVHELGPLARELRESDSTRAAAPPRRARRLSLVRRHSSANPFTGLLARGFVDDLGVGTSSSSEQSRRRRHRGVGSMLRRLGLRVEPLRELLAQVTRLSCARLTASMSVPAKRPSTP